MFEIIFLITTGIYFLVLIFLSLGLTKNFPRQSYKPFVSVIIAARNEQENIFRCLQSLDNQDYLKTNYEVILADDFSSDATSEIIDIFLKDKKNFIKVIPDTDRTGKINALNAAVKISTGDILLFTDADCIIPATWISGVVGYYKSKTGMVNSFSVTNADDILSGIQSIDLLFLISVAAGMANNGYPASCIGNNMSLRKEAYDSAGGYSSLPASVTEDYALMNEIKKLGKYEIIFPLDEKILVTTRAHGAFSDIINQKKRWASGGLALPNISMILMLLSYSVNFMLVLSFFFYSAEVLAIISVKIISEFLLLYQAHKQLNLTKNLRYFLFFEIYYIIYTLFIPVILIFNKKIIWKERTY
jgi:cellulose synthase/poly-beta-1,6-N-acetylglucosamine synthase-like glycosyltransferase